MPRQSHHRDVRLWLSPNNECSYMWNNRIVIVWQLTGCIEFLTNMRHGYAQMERIYIDWLFCY
uniref:Uncharacterized protein n=1 Tax=Heterorhabditis bacteriophora TaxID=37862 RepID=A0A1I7XDR4_HETBA